MSAIAKAFVVAKRAFAPALKASSNPHFKSKYADLAGCLEAVNDALLEAGIAVYQETAECADGVIVETVFLHESGETLRGGKLHVPASKQDPQGYGSALTYARRYSLMAACGIAAEDDDGNAATKTKPNKPAQPANPLDAVKPKSGIPLMTPGSESALSFHEDASQWAAAYEALADRVAASGKIPHRQRMTKLRELRQSNEATFGILTPEQLAGLAGSYKRRLSALGAEMNESDI